MDPTPPNGFRAAYEPIAKAIFVLLAVGWYVIRALRGVRLVRDVKVPTAAQLADRKISG